MTNDQDFRPALIRLLPDLRAFARFLSRDPAAADDLVQDTLLRALRNEEQWQPGTSLRAWTFSILRNAWFENRRRAAARQRALDRVTVEEEVPAGQEHRMEVMGLARALNHLPREQQEALVLVGALGFSNEDAARVAGVQVGTFKTRLSRARKALASQYGSEPDQGVTD
ncbi:sigma-70 family RNA polymerase sigma factor [Roseomonas sp. SSH11]|uniref:Sigma-70 family RNA polymerase sigma factor n=1 Tax=Pararoseomonas baculiformis TaxID=2820812 RepID=A0ABS4AGC7_9PROT|nr:sigma-70 family RNA polymerase sigma factor [Pararoseomonas baculiformis]MBP0446077.1 sigma-70 family RNA polymerase sigma factor [Pararoseomonas baculiformis]